MVFAETTSNFTIDSCSFQRNTDVNYMFSISEAKNITVKNTEFIDNDAEMLVSPHDRDIEFEDSNRFANNTFDAAAREPDPAQGN